MIRFSLIALLVMALVTAVAIFLAVLQGKRAKKSKKETALLHDALWEVTRKAGQLQKTLGETAKVEEEANAERRKLNAAADSDLVSRANALFGVRDRQGGNSGGN